MVALVMAIGTHMGESLTPQTMPELSFW
jgi:hypothetical protein